MLAENPYIRRLEHTDVGVPSSILHQVYAQGRIDPVTLGCTSVKSDVTLRKNGTLESLTMKYWYRLPNNQDIETTLFDIKTAPNGLIMSIVVSGRSIDMGQPEAVEATLQAIRHIHDDLKESRYPNIALAYHENELAKHIGRSVKIVGQKLSGEADFSFSSLFNFQTMHGKPQDIALPQDNDMFKSLLGLGANPLRPDMDLLAARQRVVPAYDPTSHATYDNVLQALERKDGGLRLNMLVHKRGDDDLAGTSEAYRDLFRAEARGGARLSLQNLVLMGENLKGHGHSAQARAMGAASGMVASFARHAAPVPLMHLVNYDLRDVMSDPKMVARLQGIEDPFLRISLAGNRYTKIHGPYGSDLGNSTLLMHAGVSILHDFAFKPAPDGEKSSGAIPSIQDWLPDLDIVCLSHRHIDHAGGIPYENFKGKLVLATPQVIEHVRDAMRSVHGSKAKSLMPEFMALTENGFHTVSKDGGKSGITILYSPNATPHSAYCTPFYYAAFTTGADNEKIIKGVYANLGDLRDEGNVDEYWFRHGWQQVLKKAHPDLDVGAIPMQPTYAEWDSTSVRYPGTTPIKSEVLENMKTAVGWFDGYTILDAHLASSDNQFDIMVQTAAALGRDFTTFGKNMETTQRIQNIFGYEELEEPWAQGHQNQMRMDAVHTAILQEKLQALAHFAPNAADTQAFSETYAPKQKDDDGEEPTREEILDAEILRLQAFRNWATAEGRTTLFEYLTADLTHTLHQRLTCYSNNYWRFKRRREFASENGLEGPHVLGPLAITRATMTSARMFADNPQRMFIGITGSQGNDVEIEAQLPKFLEKRSLLNLDPRYRHTARPVDPARTVMMITQPAIPGNEKARHRLVHKAAREYGLIVVNTTHDGFEIYNTHKLAAGILDKIREDLLQKGVMYQENPVDHALVVAGPMPLGYRGHGRRQDIARWMMRTRAEVNSPQHINDPEAARDIEILSASLHQGHIPLVEDFEVSAIDRFASTPSAKVRVLGTIPAGLTILRIEHPYQKPYRPVIHRQRIVVLEPDRKASLMQPLMAGCRSRSVITHDFGPIEPADNRDIKKSDTPRARTGTRAAFADKSRLPDRSELWTIRPPVIPVPVPEMKTPARMTTRKSMTIELI